MDEIRPESEATAAADDLRGARPAPDRVAMDTVRARAESALFGVTAPSRLGRYLVVDRLAGGGMGVVYRGYDPELHRKVALKVLHPRQHGDDRAQARMIAEARALAKLDHPNVVRIHDVLDIDGQVVLVMELIEGTTLADWERSSRHPWRDIVAMYLQAGHGLAAAHSVGILHRDFKPANVIIGNDGRVRVLDFGLARDARLPDDDLATGSPASLPEINDSPAPLTATGEVVGTLGYTSPEQLAGEPATPASDQFSFCVSLHRALERVPPFQGTDPTSLLASIRAGTIARATEGSASPAWLRALVTRGLRATPSERFPSLADLLLELGRLRGWRRWRGLVLAAAIVATAGIALAIRPSPSAHGPTCDGGAAVFAETWNDTERSRIAAVIFSPDIRGHVISTLDAYRDRWVTVHDDACLVHSRGEQSDTILDLRMACLARRRVELRESLAVLSQATAATAANAIDIIARLPDPALCADIAHLQAESEPPTTPAQRHQVDGVRAALSRAAALERAGRSDEALTLATATLADAGRTAYPPVITEAGLLRGRILLSRRDYIAAAPQLAETRTLALQHRLFAMAVEAAARQLYVEAMERAEPSAIAREAAVFEPLSESLTGDKFARPLLLNNIGSAYMALGDRATATTYFQRAHDALTALPGYDIELTCVDRNLAMVMQDDATRAGLIFSVWERRRDVLGEHHLDTLEALEARARYATDPNEALALTSEVCALYDAHHPALIAQRAYCHHFAGLLLDYLGDEDAALAQFKSLSSESTTDEYARPWLRLAAAEAARLAGDNRTATTLFNQALAEDSKSKEWFLSLRANHARLGLARVHGDPALYAVAATTYENALIRGEDIEMKLRLAMALRQHNLARRRNTHE